MSENSIHLKLKINFPVIFFIVLFMHAFLFSMKQLQRVSSTPSIRPETTPLKIRRIKTQGRDDGILKSDFAFKPKGSPPLREQISLKDLSATKAPSLQNVPKKVEVAKTQRPGTRPEAFVKYTKAINSISLKSPEFENHMKAHPSGGLAVNDLNSSAQRISDAVVSLEVPDGIEESELNKYELMFYSFQRRTAMNYAGSIIKNLNKFLRENPNYKIDQDIIMTARMTFDEKGNVKQIKMIRWTNIDKMQNFFEDVVKGIDQLHNPPKALWKNSGEFSMFFTLEVNG